MIWTPEEMRELFALDGETGRIYFRPRDRKWFENDQSCKTWNTRFAEKETFAFFDKQKKEYTGCVFGQTVRRAVIAYCLANGEWPTHRIGFHDDDKTNTRPDNLYHKEPRK